MGIVEKVLVWRLISIVSGITIVLQVVLLLAEALFECWRELLKKVRKKMGLEKNPPRKTASGRKDDDITDHNAWRPGK